MSQKPSPRSPLSPPRARITFRVGIVGHRPNRLPNGEGGWEAIRGRLTTVLDATRRAVEAFRSEPGAALYDEGLAELRAISPLAEGADRLFAEEALNFGYALCCPMPFSRTEFEKDFAHGAAQEAGSAERFDALLGRAAGGAGLTVFELDGSRADEAGAYGAAGRVVLNQSDLLVVVWDGEAPAGGGGTVETLREAVGYHVPVIWVDAKAPHGWALLREEADLDCLEVNGVCIPPWTGPAGDEDIEALAESVAEVVLAELRLPREGPGVGAASEVRTHAQAYFAEHKPRLNGAFVWKAFRDLMGSGRLRLPALRVEDFISQIRGGWPVSAEDTDSGETPPDVTKWVNARLRGHYAWADKLADLYADAHRSSGIVASLFAALAVFVALLPTAMDWGDDHIIAQRICNVTEVVILVVTVSLLTIGRRRRWHERWLEYRVLAELIRQLRLLAPLGGGRPLPRTPAHLAIYGDPTRSWMYWQVRAIARSLGIPNLRVTPAYTAECLDYLFDIADGPQHGQLRFHIASHVRSEKIGERLEQGTLLLFWVSIAGIVINFALPSLALWDPQAATDRAVINRWLTLLSAVTPAFGAALASINNLGEFSRLAKRSRAMADGFIRFRNQITAMRAKAAGPPPLPIAEVTHLAGRMAEAMVEENVDWRVVVLDLPHSAG